MTSQELLYALVRTTLFTSISIGIVWLFASRVCFASPRILRVAWTLAIAQAWLLFPWTWQIESSQIVKAPPAILQVRPQLTTTVTLATGDPSASQVENLPFDQPTTPFDAPRWLLTAWVVGAGVMVLAGLRRYARFVRDLPAETSTAESNEDWHAEWRQLVANQEVRQHAELRISHGLGPLVCYVPFRYFVLAPLELWKTLTKPERVAILRHELAHLKRRDVWKSLGIRLFALPQWFNPLVWRAVRAFDEAGEWACDDEVARTEPNGPLNLARSLVHAAEYVTTGVLASASAQGGVLSRRIRRLVAPQIMEDGKMKRFAIVALLISLVGVQAVRIERVAAAPPQEGAETPSKAVVLGALPSRDMPAQQSPAVVANVQGNADPMPMQLIAAENGATVGSALSPVARWFAPKALRESKLILRRPNRAQDAWDELPITWDANAGQPTQETNHVLQPGDVILICDQHMPESGPNMPTPSGKRSTSSQASVLIKASRADMPDEQGIPIAVIDPRESTTVASAIAVGMLGPWADPIDLATATITVFRKNAKYPGGGTKLAVKWDRDRGRPTDETNHTLQPGDEIFVRPLVHQSLTSTLPPSSIHPNSQRSTPDRRGPRVLFNVAIVEDLSNSLSEFDADGLHRGAVMVDAEAMRGTLRILELHRLVLTLGHAQAVSVAGERVKIQRDGIPFQLELTAVQKDKELVGSYTLTKSTSGQRTSRETAIAFEPGKSALLRAPSRPATIESAGKDEAKTRLVPTYVIVTPQGY